MGNAKLSPDDIKRIRKLRAMRETVAEKAGVAVAWVDAEGNVDPRAKKMPKQRTPAKR